MIRMRKAISFISYPSIRSNNIGAVCSFAETNVSRVHIRSWNFNICSTLCCYMNYVSTSRPTFLLLMLFVNIMANSTQSHYSRRDWKKFKTFFTSASLRTSREYFYYKVNIFSLYNLIKIHPIRRKFHYLNASELHDILCNNSIVKVQR